MKTNPEPRDSKIKPWPGCSFKLKIEFINDTIDRIRNMWVYLERRASGKYGRLLVMHALIPAKNADPKDQWLFGARFHRNLYVRALEVFKQADLPDALRERFLKQMARELPIPTETDLFMHSIGSPSMNKILGERKKDLSYFRTGKPELTNEDKRLIKKLTEKKFEELRTHPHSLEETARFLQEMML